GAEMTAGGYTRMQVPGLPGIFFRDQVLTLGARRLRVYGASAVDVLAARSIGRAPYWAVAWPAGLALARFLAGRDLSGRRVLEVGSGVGVSGLGAALAGADVLVTDNVVPALRVAAMNARRNDLPLRAAAADWRAWPLRERFDMVVGSDVTYEPAAFDALLAVLRASLAPGGEVLLTEPRRSAMAAFLDRARELGWDTGSSELPPEGAQPVRIHRLRL
ncbi:MAG TPA: methyltransferase domain-containing protein, partial [Armatimonadota bacterium]|nr:methyltransferase domain-containing protein [Armatimonadota bacterium]